MKILSQLQKFTVSTQIAIHSLSIGTFLFLLHFIIESPYLYFIGYFYVIIAVIMNSIVLLWLFYNLIIDYSKRQQIIIQILILLANIPIAIFYFYVVISGITLNSEF